MKDLTEDRVLYSKLYEVIDNSIEYDWSDAMPSMEINVDLTVGKILKIVKEYIENET